MAKSKADQVVIKLLDHTTNKFTEQDLQNQINLHGEYPEDPYKGWRRVYPELFGDKLPKGLRFVRFELCPISVLDHSSQDFRIGGRSQKKFVEIGQNIERNGYKLKYPPVSVFFRGDLDHTRIITGNTRTELLEKQPFFMENVIIARYEADPDVDSEEVEDAIEECGGMFNSIHDPASTVSQFDAKKIVTKSIERFIKTKGQYGTPCTMDSISGKIDKVCGEGVFQPAVRSNLVYEIWNNFKPEAKVISWSAGGKTDHKVETFMQHDAKFMDSNTVKYQVTSTQTQAQAWHKAMRLAAKYPDCEIRVMLHTGTLSGFDLPKTYRTRISEFMRSWNEMTENACLALFGKNFPTNSNIVVYGALPALSSVHNTEKPFYFKHKTTTCYQKHTDGGYSFDYTDPEGLMGSTLEEFLEAA